MKDRKSLQKTVVCFSTGRLLKIFKLLICFVFLCLLLLFVLKVEDFVCNCKWFYNFTSYCCLSKQDSLENAGWDL